MKKILTLFVCLFCLKAIAQDAPLKMEVPNISMGENQNFQALSFEAVGPDKFAILYFQELPASIVGEREFRSDKMMGAFVDAETKQFVPHSERVIFLLRQTFGKTGDPMTEYWVIAMRELTSNMKYVMHYPANFVHPFVKNGIQVNNSLKNLEQLKGLTPREFEAMVLFAKQKYGFYTYPEPTFSVRNATLKEEMDAMRSGFKELGAVFSKGDVPKTEKQLFKRDLVNGIRLMGTKIDKKDSVEVKLYLSTKDDANYELLKRKTFAGSITPNFASALVYDYGLKIAGGFGYMVLKYKDAAGDNKSSALAMGIDNNGDGQIWRMDIGKNSLNSFNPWFSYINDNGSYVVSTNNEKVFKPYYQHHLLKKDGTAVTLYPTNPTEMNSEKSQFMYTDQVKNAGYASAQYSTETKSDIPVGIYELHNNNKFILTNQKILNNTSGATVTTYGNLSVMRIDNQGKVKELYDIQENKSQAPVWPRMLGTYKDKTYFMINYPNKFKLVLSENKIETEPSETAVYRLVYMPTEDYLSTNQFGSMLLTKTAVGNKYLLEFYPVK